MNVRNRDLGILIICVITILLSNEIGSDWTLKHAFSENIETRFYSNSHFPLPHEKLPQPIVTDIDGDSFQDVLIATKEPAIKIYRFDQMPQEKGRQPNLKQALKLKSRSSLLLETRVGKSRQAVAMKTGYLDLLADISADISRQQYIVVFTAGWDVICFNYKLDVVWERSIQKTIGDDYYTKEAAIIVTPAEPFGQGNGNGMVIVGARLALLQDSQIHERTHKHDKIVISNLENENENEEKDIEPEENIEDSENDHFSYFAFEGKTGKLLWKHEPSDFNTVEMGPIEESAFIQSHYKVDVRIPMKHEGESDWRRYRHSIVNVLPHSWRSREDTSLTLSSFHKNKKKNPGKSQNYHQEVTGMNWISQYNIDVLGQQQDNIKSTTGANNVLVAFLHDGIEVLQLHSGQPVCRVPLAGDFHGNNGVYADINGDGVIDHVIALAGKNNAPLLKRLGGGKLNKQICHALALSGIGANVIPLFNGSLCTSSSSSSGSSNSPGGVVDEFFLTAAQFLEEGVVHYAQTEQQDDLLQTVDPVLIPTKQRTKFYNSHHLHYDSVFLVSNGKMTSYQSGGILNWQIDTGSGWSKSLQKSAKFEIKEDSYRLMDFVQNAFHPSLSTFQLTQLNQEKQVVAIGWQGMTIVGVDGSLLAEIHLPEPPIGPPVFGDFNNDGFHDIIVPGRGGFYGFSVEHRVGSMIFSNLILGLVGLLLLLFVNRVIIQPKDVTKKAFQRGTD